MRRKGEDFGLGWSVKSMQRAKGLVLDILRRDKAKEYSIKEILEAVGKQVGESLVRSALALAVRSGRVTLRRHAHNLCTYQLRQP